MRTRLELFTSLLEIAMDYTEPQSGVDALVPATVSGSHQARTCGSIRQNLDKDRGDSALDAPPTRTLNRNRGTRLDCSSLECLSQQQSVGSGGKREERGSTDTRSCEHPEYGSVVVERKDNSERGARGFDQHHNEMTSFLTAFGIELPDSDETALSSRSSTRSSSTSSLDQEIGAAREAAVEQLTSMGFSCEAASIAVAHMGTDLESALWYLSAQADAVAAKVAAQNAVDASCPKEESAPVEAGGVGGGGGGQDLSLAMAAASLVPEFPPAAVRLVNGTYADAIGTDAHKRDVREAAEWCITAIGFAYVNKVGG